MELQNRWMFLAIAQKKYSRLDKLFCPAHCRGGYYFSLDRKVAKDQDGKNLLPARPAPGPVFRQAFAHFYSKKSYFLNNTRHLQLMGLNPDLFCFYINLVIRFK
jgi:hypothetical protein